MQQIQDCFIYLYTKSTIAKYLNQTNGIFLTKISGYLLFLSRYNGLYGELIYLNKAIMFLELKETSIN